MESIKKIQGKKKRSRPPRGAARRRSQRHTHCHPFEIRRKAAQFCLEEKFPVRHVAREVGVGLSTLGKWVKVYRGQGETSLESHPRRAVSHRPKVASEVKTKVVELKRRHPDLGIQKISHFLRRALFLPVSRETVRRTLHDDCVNSKSRYSWTLSSSSANPISASLQLQNMFPFVVSGWATIPLGTVLNDNKPVHFQIQSGNPSRLGFLTTTAMLTECPSIG